MDETIAKLEAVKNALCTLTITSTRHNLNVLLGSIQELESVIDSLREEQNGRILSENLPF